MQNCKNEHTLPMVSLSKSQFVNLSKSHIDKVKNRQIHKLSNCQIGACVSNIKVTTHQTVSPLRISVVIYTALTKLTKSLTVTFRVSIRIMIENVVNDTSMDFNCQLNELWIKRTSYDTDSLTYFLSAVRVRQQVLFRASAVILSK